MYLHCNRIYCNFLKTIDVTQSYKTTQGMCILSNRRFLPYMHSPVRKIKLPRIPPFLLRRLEILFVNNCIVNKNGICYGIFSIVKL